MNERIPKNGKVNNYQTPIIPLQRTVVHDNKKDIKYIEHTCHNTPGDSTTGKYVIKVPIYDSGHPEEWIIFTELVNKCLVGQDITTGPQMYQLVQRVLQGDAKAQFDTQAAAHGSQTAANFKAIMATMTVHVFPRYALQDQKRYMRRYLKKPLGMKVRSFTTRLTQLNNYLSSFPPDSPGQLVEKLPNQEVKEILFYAMPETWQNRMTEQGYNYLDVTVSVQNMADFFESRSENLEVKTGIKKAKKSNNKSSKKRKAVQLDEESEESSEDEKSHRSKYCMFHERCGHTTDQCTALKGLVKNKKKKRSKYDKKSKRKSEKTYTRQEVNALVEKKIKKALHGKKKKRRHDELHEFENLDISDGEKTSASANSSSSSSLSSSDSE